MRRKSRERSSERNTEETAMAGYQQLDSQSGVARNRRLTWLKVVVLIGAGLALVACLYGFTSSSNDAHSLSLKSSKSNGPFLATAVINVGDTGARIGKVSAVQEIPGGPVTITGVISGLSPNAKHGFHVHSLGNLEQGCNSTGVHFNPFNRDHGGPTDSERHVGDLGNIETDSTGTAKIHIVDELISLTTGLTSIIGRTFVVHLGIDDLGKGGYSDSLTTGHAGYKYACGVIGINNT